MISRTHCSCADYFDRDINGNCRRLLIKLPLWPSLGGHVHLHLYNSKSSIFCFSLQPEIIFNQPIYEICVLPTPTPYLCWYEGISVPESVCFLPLASTDWHKQIVHTLLPSLNYSFWLIDWLIEPSSLCVTYFSNPPNSNWCFWRFVKGPPLLEKKFYLI